MNYHQRIRDLREAANLTQKQVAEYLHISVTMYARYERGASQLPIRCLLLLCDLYDKSAEYILCRAEE